MKWLFLLNSHQNIFRLFFWTNRRRI